MTESKQEFLARHAKTYREYVTATVLHAQAAADAAGMGPTDLYALNVLALAGGLTAGELAERTGLTSGATTRLVDRLERSGHVRRTTDPADRRRVVIEPAGVRRPEARLAELGGLFEDARRGVGEILLGYSLEELELLVDYFGRTTEVLREATTRLRANTPERERAKPANPKPARNSGHEKSPGSRAR